MGKMVPRQEGWRSVGTEMVLFGLASYAAVFGVSYAYVLHQVGNGFAAWVVGMSFLEGRREGAKVAGTGKVEERLDEGVKRDGKGKE